MPSRGRGPDLSAYQPTESHVSHTQWPKEYSITEAADGLILVLESHRIDGHIGERVRLHEAADWRRPAIAQPAREEA